MTAIRLTRPSRSRLRALCIHAGAVLLIGTAAHADDATDTFDLGTVEVIGVRAAAAAQTTDTLTASEMAAGHRDNLAEALDMVPGVASQNLGQRRERLLALRGFSSRQVPLFIDGVPVYVPYDGNVDLARFGVDYVSQIVVSKGLASLLYGPNILGGAINVVSRRPTQPLEASARIAWEGDSDLGTVEQRIAGTLGARRGAWYATLSASYADSPGYRLSSDFTPVAAEDGGRRENADSRDSVISAKLGFAPSDAHEIALSYYRQHGAKQDPPYAGSYLRTATRPDGMTPRYWRWPWWNKDSIYLVARDALGEHATLRWRVFHDSFRNSLESYDDATYTTQNRPFAFHGSQYDDYTWGGSADLDWRWGASNATRIAGHYRQDVHREMQVTPALPWQRLDIATWNVALEHEWRPLAALTVTPSYSHMIQPAKTVQVYTSSAHSFSPVHTDRSNADNAQLVVDYALDDSNSFLAGVSRKTRFPTIKERFSGGMGTAVPNPGLKAETAEHVELGYRYHAAALDLKLALFQSRLHDAIQSVAMPATACNTPPCTQLQNVARQRNRGLEASFSYAPLPTLQIDGQVNVVDVTNLSAPSIRPTGIPEVKTQLAAAWRFLPRWQLRVDGRNESKRYSNSAGTRVAGAFTLVNTFVRVTPLEHLGLDIGVRNLTDRLYAYDEGYYEPGRSWLAQLDWRL